jgi:hypothetical protein
MHDDEMTCITTSSSLLVVLFITFTFTLLPFSCPHLTLFYYIFSYASFATITHCLFRHCLLYFIFFTIPLREPCATNRKHVVNLTLYAQKGNSMKHSQAWLHVIHRSRHFVIGQ